MAVDVRNELAGILREAAGKDGLEIVVNEKTGEVVVGPAVIPVMIDEDLKEPSPEVMERLWERPAGQLHWGEFQSKGAG